MHGLSDFENLCYLQVNGQNKLQKEIEEISRIDDKFLDPGALHINEGTKEIEGMESVKINQTQ